MPSFSFKPASEFSISQTADLLTRGFEGYLVPINIDESALLTMLRRDGIDFNESRILLNDDEPIGVALIAKLASSTESLSGIAMCFSTAFTAASRESFMRLASFIAGLKPTEPKADSDQGADHNRVPPANCLDRDCHRLAPQNGRKASR